MKLKIKAFLFAFNIIRRTVFKSFMVHYNSYKNAHTNLNLFGVKSNERFKIKSDLSLKERKLKAEDIRKEWKEKGRPEIKEDNREVLVCRRREGKTYEMCKVAIERAINGQNVLFVTFNSVVLNTTVMYTMEHILNTKLRFYNYKYNKKENIIFINNNIIELKSIEYLKSEYFNKKLYLDYYKIYDEVQLDSPIDFDLISITGKDYIDD